MTTSSRPADTGIDATDEPVCTDSGLPELTVLGTARLTR